MQTSSSSSSSSYPDSRSSPEDDVDKLINELPKMRFMETTVTICKWEGFWFTPGHVKSAITFQSSFEARDDDVFLASTMKTGTTWLKSLALSIIQKSHDYDLLATENPHFHVPTIESIFHSTKAPPFDPYDASVPRLLHTHLPYALLPGSLKFSKGKIVYIARNPKDTVVSFWHFFNSSLRPNQEPFPLEKMVESFCSGDHLRGPFFEHVVGYFLESRKRPEKVLFLKYEELKSDPRKHVSRIAQFLGRPLADEGEVDEVVRRCCMERLKNLEVNKKGSVFINAPNSIFFRKGEVGDWTNYLTPEMELQINQTSRIKLEPFGLFL